MKSFNTIAVLAAAASVLAVPTPTEELVPRASASSTSLTAITVKGNGRGQQPLDKASNN